MLFWLSVTGAPAAVVSGSVFSSNAIFFSVVSGGVWVGPSWGLISIWLSVGHPYTMNSDK
jgi:hypothetical protein